MKRLLENFQNKDLKIFMEEFNDFLPDNIYDFHVHMWKKEFIKEEISKERERQITFFDPDIISGFKIEDFKKITKKIFPGKKCNGLFFGLPMKEINISENNSYIAEINKDNNSYGLFVPEPDLKEIPEDFFDNRFIGFKPYPDLARSSKINDDISIFDFISDAVLEFCHEYGLILLIHLPRERRLNDERNIEEIKAIGKRYPKIKIILAHAGRSYCYYDIKNSIKYLKGLKNLYVDTSMINEFSVNQVLMKELGPEKILFGSDLSLAVLKGKNIDINNKHYFITSEPRTWSLSSSQIALDDFTLFIYEMIRALRIASKNLKLGNRDIDNIFYSNANRLINDIVQL
jgi:predicted TIM-barrel fold metal-dependent hydrolase